MTERRAIRVTGIVQGVGFRPFVHVLAVRLGLAGFVGNDERGVVVEAEGPGAALDTLERALAEGPPAALVTGVTAARIPPRGEHGFAIVASEAHGSAATLISPDLATCVDCVRELFDPADRRFRHPFLSCTNCGPRFTIVTGVPYDRGTTTMAGFPMCPACAAEYHDPADRRFHAQPICCPDCGPVLRFLPGWGAGAAGGPGADDRDVADRDVAGRAAADQDRAALRPPVRRLPTADPITAAAEALLGGAVVAVKGLGGYHLAALAADPRPVGALRARKHREDKPFAVLVPDLEAARKLCEVAPEEEALLRSVQAPIVLLRRRPDAEVAAAVAPGDRHLGLLLPYTPVHHLLSAAVGAPIVLTSGNVSDEPIAHRDADARDRLAGIADAALVHDRPIRTRADDSVARIARGAPYLVRRSRGYAPAPLPLAFGSERVVLGCGAELKNTICLLRGREAFVSHHVGDLENAETLAAFTDAIAHLGRLLEVTPELVAHDLHPEYLSTKWAFAQDLPLVGVQHHHAHLAACLVEHGESGPAIGVACDGLGYGTDGTLWGGEVLDVSLTGFTRVAHLEPVPLPGGTTAIRQPWRTAAAWLRTAGTELPGMPERIGAAWLAVQALLDSPLGQPLTTSAGRLCDAVAALCGLRYRTTYEGQAAIELERLAAPGITDAYPVTIHDQPARYLAATSGRDAPPAVIMVSELVRAVVAELRRGVEAPLVAARFHNGLAVGLATAAVDAARERGRDTVALSGGVFQNMLLLEGVRAHLEREGLRVLVHSRLPCTDAGISLGQVAVAAATTARPHR